MKKASLLTQPLSKFEFGIAGNDAILAQSLTTHNHNTHPEQPSKLSEFFRQSPLVELTEELDLSRDRSLPRDAFTP